MMRPPPRRLAPVAVVLAALIVDACTVGPNYHLPTAPTATTFKEAEGWTAAQPADAIPKGAWWSLFNDPVLDGLEQRVVVTNQNVAAALAAYRQAQAITAEDRASFFPTIGVNASAQRSKSGGSRSGSGIATSTSTTTTGTTTGTTGTGTTGTGTTGTGTTGTGTTGTGTTGVGTTGGGTSTSTGTGQTIFNDTGSAITTYSTGLSASWTPDVWGRIRRQVESDVANAQATAADLANATLAAQAQLAVAYFDLRVLDQQKRLYDDTVAAYAKALKLTQNQYAVGVVAKADVITAQTQLLTAQASAADIATQRAQDEHAVAALIGVPPADLTIAPTTLSMTVPVAPTGLASTLLQRRPDIAAAERAVKQANALIGVQVAAYFPDITLSGDFGFESSNLGSLFRASNDFWSFGGNLTDTLLDFGARKARVREARAVYDQRVAQYRETVLTAFQGVEDQLAALKTLQSESGIRDRTLTSARLAEQLALNQYRAGLVDYTTVVNAEATALASAQNVLTILRSRQNASVLLIEDLGGGWTTADLPKR